MIYVHEVHEVLGGRMEEFGEAVRGEWRPLVEEGGRARLLWFWQLTHGTGASYQAVSITAVRDWATWGELVGDPRLQAWQRRGWTLRREVTAKVLLPVAWAPLQEVDLAAAPVGAETDSPSLYLHDTGWPFPGKLEEYVAALGSIFYPQTRRARMISVAACWTGRTTTVDEWDNPMNSGFARFTGWAFEQPWELVPGPWKIEMLLGDRVLAAQDFQVRAQAP